MAFLPLLLILFLSVWRMPMPYRLTWGPVMLSWMVGALSVPIDFVKGPWFMFGMVIAAHSLYSKTAVPAEDAPPVEDLRAGLKVNP